MYKNIFQFVQVWVNQEFVSHSLLFRRHKNSTRRKPASSFLRNQQTRSRMYKKNAKRRDRSLCASSRLLFKWMLRTLLSPKPPGDYKVFAKVRLRTRFVYTKLHNSRAASTCESQVALVDVHSSYIIYVFYCTKRRNQMKNRSLYGE